MKTAYFMDLSGIRKNQYNANRHISKKTAHRYIRRFGGQILIASPYSDVLINAKKAIAYVS